MAGSLEAVQSLELEDRSGKGTAWKLVRLKGTYVVWTCKEYGSRKIAVRWWWTANWMAEEGEEDLEVDGEDDVRTEDEAEDCVAWKKAFTLDGRREPQVVEKR